MKRKSACPIPASLVDKIRS
uniref:Uncharacterized protein n=1 Tax=Arundo donax TaxID=35708 RepID=A0A0A9CWL8_ARUDO